MKVEEKRVEERREAVNRREGESIGVTHTFNTFARVNGLTSCVRSTNKSKKASRIRVNCAAFMEPAPARELGLVVLSVLVSASTSSLSAFAASVSASVSPPATTAAGPSTLPSASSVGCLLEASESTLLS